MLAQVRIFSRDGKYRSLLGDFSSRTNTFVLKIPNRPSGCTPLDTLPESSAGAEHEKQWQMLSICSYSYEYSKMSFELLETIQVTQKELLSKSASGILKNRQIYLYTVIYCPLLP